MHLIDAVYRHATKIIHHHSKAETISKLTVHSQLLQNHFSTAKINNLTTKLGQGVRSPLHTTLAYLGSSGNPAIFSPSLVSLEVPAVCSTAPSSDNCRSAVTRQSEDGGSMKSKLVTSLIPRIWKIYGKVLYIAYIRRYFSV